ncbi:MAG: hypothetical protein DIU71_11000 [Proteobacteria bacterium]|nr:MAG: hypothetical protein DIU71_11000 [Pseudomonadota bacterium]
MTTHPNDTHQLDGEDIVAFGSFQLNRTRRILSSAGRRIAVRSRAMEILVALTERAGAILSNRELLQRVWPGMVVEEGTIRVHVALLRKVLREVEPDSDFVHNVTGRGYRFVAPVVRQRPSGDAPMAESSGSMVLQRCLPPLRRNDLAVLPDPVFDSDRSACMLGERLARARLVTVTGPGGIGKTVAALAAAEALGARCAHGVCYVDVSSSRSRALWCVLAAALGWSPDESGSRRELLRHLSKQSMLLVLDSCEQAIDSAASLVEDVLRSCPQVSMIATSREPLRAAGETIHELAPLGWSAPSAGATGGRPPAYPAIQLFLERAGDALARPDEEALALVATLCRRLGGNPLAIEIAAAQVRWLGLRTLALDLPDSMLLGLEGRRTAAPRHRTLRASFDWSYGLLSQAEQAVFRWLSVFTGSFTVDRAVEVVADEQLPPDIVMECLVKLARKSLIIADRAGCAVMYRLHDLARAYAHEKLHQHGELSLI